MSSEQKITERHRQRRAVVYVRQSTLVQVERNTESAQRQYALRDRAIDLGWPASSVVSVDEQVRHAIERVFELWRRLGTARQIVGELIADGQKLPRRRVGERRVRWATANYAAVHDFLTNPSYAGAFVFGRTRQEKRLDA